MITQELIDYIKQQLNQGVEKEKIKQLLLANGWQNEDIEKAFEIIAQPSMTQTSEIQKFISPKKKRIKKIIAIILGIFVFLLIIDLSFLPLMNLFAKDIPSIDDSDLQLQKVVIPDEENAYFDLIKIKDVIYYPKDKSNIIFDIIDGKTWDEQFVEEILSKNSKAFEYFDKAFLKPKYQNPELKDLNNIDLEKYNPPLGTYQNISYLNAIKALYLSKQGNDKEALDEILKSIDVAQKIQNSQTSLLEYLITLGMKNISLKTMQKIVSSSKLKGNELKSYIQNLDKFYNNSNDLIKTLKVEYNIVSYEINLIANGDTKMLKLVSKDFEDAKIKEMISNNYYFLKNKTKLLFAENTRMQINNASQVCGEIKNTENKELVPENKIPENKIKMIFEENIIGKMLYDTLAINPSSLFIGRCQSDLLVGATQTIIAIKAYKNDKNSYPNSLNDLIPDYLSSIPKDPFDGGQLKYSLQKKIIYSIGKDIQNLENISKDLKSNLSLEFKIDF